MNLLTPLGLIALISLIILFIIYIIKPSYQNKLLPSTYIWKESLKYKKSDRPTSKLRNILLIICQILIIVLSSLILATPFVKTQNVNEGRQDILIIDGSANMQIASDGVSRFDRAKAQIKEYSKDSIKGKNDITIIFAGDKATYLAKNERDMSVIEKNLNGAKCDLTNGDIESAMMLAKEQVDTGKLSKVYLYTATKYQNYGDVNVVNVATKGDWNASILDVRPEVVENWCEFDIDMAVTGTDKYLNVLVNIYGVNDKKEHRTIEKRVNCTEGNVVTLRLKDLEIYAYDSIEVEISVDDESVDSFNYDDKFCLYGGRKEVINIQYYSTAPNNFFNSALLVLKDKYKDKFDIKVANPKDYDLAKNKGFDFYIYEHSMPKVMPKDGIVFLVNPDVMPSRLDVAIGDENIGNYTFNANTSHPIMKYINAKGITATKYRAIKANGFENLMFCGNDSVFAIKDSDDTKVAILTLDLNRSNLPMLIDFPILINNIFEYFLPSTLSGEVFDIGSDIAVTARGQNVNLVSGKDKREIGAKSTISINKVGKYTIEQTLLSHKKVSKDFYVKIPTMQSNACLELEEIAGLFEIKKPKNPEKDILIYLASAELVLVCVERFLHSLENV